MALSQQYIKIDLSTKNSDVFVKSFNPIQADQPTQDNSLYHEGYTLMSEELKFIDDEGNVEITVEEIETVSGNKEIGLFEQVDRQVLTFDNNIQTVKDYFWNEVFTTPIGLFNILQAKNNVTTLNNSSNNQQIQRLYDTVDNGSNRFVLKIKDFNIIPKAGDYLIVQYIEQDNTVYGEPYYQADVTNDVTTDDLNNLPIHNISEVYSLKILSVNLLGVNTLGTLSQIGNRFEIITDKSIKFINDSNSTPGTKYTLVLLNRYNEVNKQGLFNKLWKQYEGHSVQLLGDASVNASNYGERSNFLNYESAGILGVINQLKPVIENDIKINDIYKTPVMVLDIDDEIIDRIHQEEISVKVHLPNILLQDNDYDFSPSNTLNSNYVINPVILENSATVNNHISLGKYSEMKFKNKKYGYVFYDLRIIVITDSELVVAMSYNGNRNYTLPNIELNTVNSRVHPVGNKNPEFSHFVTYKIKGKHYKETMPYSKIIPFNWAVGNKNPDLDDINYVSQLASSDLKINKIDLFRYLYTTSSLLGFHGEEIEFIIGEFDYTKETIDANNDRFILKGVKNIKVINNVEYPDLDNLPNVLTSATYSLLDLSGKQKTSHENFVINYVDYQNSPSYNLDGILYKDVVSTSGFFTGRNNWFVGIVEHKQQVKQHRMKISYTIPANRFNGTTNPTFEAGNEYMLNKFISEAAFLIGEYTDENNNVIENDDIWIFAKFNPPIKKNNQLDINLELTLDF